MELITSSCVYHKLLNIAESRASNLTVAEMFGSKDVGSSFLKNPKWNQ